MKKSILTLTAMSILALTACGNSSPANELPSGGKEVDVTTAEGKTTLKNCLNNAKKAYQTSIDGIGVTAKLEGGNLSVNASADLSEMKLGQVALGLNVKDVAANEDFRFAKTGEDGVAASAKSSVTSGSLSITGTIPGEGSGEAAKINQSLNFAGTGINAYLSGNKVYTDISNTSNFVTGLETFANGLLSDLKVSFIGQLVSYYLVSILPEEASGLYDPVENKFNIAKEYEKLPKKSYTELPRELKWSDLFSDESQLDFDADKVADYVTSMTETFPGLVFKSYDSGAFGFSIDVTKESLEKMIPEGEGAEAKAYLNYFTKINVSAALYFNEKFMIDYAGVSADIALSVTDLSAFGEAAAKVPVKDLSLTASLSGKTEVRFNYKDVKVELPSADELAKYEKAQF